MYIGLNYVNGDFHPTRPDFSNENPVTEESLGLFPSTTPTEVNEAVEAARSAFAKWRTTSKIYRADLFDVMSQLLKRDHEDLVKTISLETGKNLNESHAEVVEALHMCQVAAASGRQSFGEVFASELSTKDVQVIRKPKGVVAVISPWNFPLAIGSFWSSAPALVEGNTVVHKPSELTPMVAQKVASLYDEAGFPPGVYNLIHGAEETGKALVRSGVDHILFTGSAEVGQEIRKHCAETWSKTCSMECGSKSATIVFADGDYDLALEASVASALKLSGQRCVSSGRILVERSIFDKFSNDFANEAGSMSTGCPFEEEAPFYGPLISREQMEKVMSFNQMVREDALCDGEDNATVLLSGLHFCCVDAHPKGHFLTPFVYKCEWGDKPFLKNEVFGPHVALVPFNDLSDAIRIYNDTEYGLALGVVTDDYRKHRRIAQECDTGMLYINGGSIAAESHIPFSSWKKSGWGASATATWKAVTHTMAVTTNFEEGKVSWAQGMK
jgi:aldehyde dehydrogenase (NAD+)